MIPQYTLPAENRQVLLVRRPAGIPLSSDFAIARGPLPTPSAGQFLVRNLYLSPDPVQRGWAANPVLSPLHAPMRALSLGVVVESHAHDVAEGDLVYGFLGWQDYAVVTREDLLSLIRTPRAVASAYAGVLGMPGVTAWLAIADLAPPSAGQNVLVSTAGGAVGSVVGQIVRAAGARAIGLTGSDAKVKRCVDQYGYELAFNYKTVDLAAALGDATPDGFQTFFDNTGGWIADRALRAMAKHGRIIQCGTAATASWSPPPEGWRPEREVLVRVLTWGGFYIFDHVTRFPEAIEALSDMIDAGTLSYDEDIDVGFDRVTGSLEALFSGDITGKKLIFIGQD